MTTRKPLPFPYHGATGDCRRRGIGFGLRSGVSLPIPVGKKPVIIGGRDFQSLSTSPGVTIHTNSRSGDVMTAASPALLHPTHDKSTQLTYQAVQANNLQHALAAIPQATLHSHIAEDHLLHIPNQQIGNTICCVKLDSPRNTGLIAFASGSDLCDVHVRSISATSSMQPTSIHETIETKQRILQVEADNIASQGNGHLLGLRFQTGVEYIMLKEQEEGLSITRFDSISMRQRVLDIAMSPYIAHQSAMMCEDGSINVWDAVAASSSRSFTRIPDSLCNPEAADANTHTHIKPPFHWTSIPKKQRKHLKKEDSKSKYPWLVADRYAPAGQWREETKAILDGWSMSRDPLCSDALSYSAFSTDREFYQRTKQPKHDRKAPKVCGVCGQVFATNHEFRTHMHAERLNFGFNSMDNSGVGDKGAQMCPRLLSRLRIYASTRIVQGLGVNKSKMEYRPFGNEKLLTRGAVEYGPHPKVLLTLLPKSVHTLDLRAKAAGGVSEYPFSSKINTPAMMTDEAYFALKVHRRNPFEFGLVSSRHLSLHDLRYPLRPLIRFDHYSEDVPSSTITFLHKRNKASQKKNINITTETTMVVEDPKAKRDFKQSLLCFRFNQGSDFGHVAQDAPQRLNLPGAGAGHLSLCEFDNQILPPPRAKAGCYTVLVSSEGSVRMHRLTPSKEAGQSHNSENRHGLACEADAKSNMRMDSNQRLRTRFGDRANRNKECTTWQLSPLHRGTNDTEQRIEELEDEIRSMLTTMLSDSKLVIEFFKERRSLFEFAQLICRRLKLDRPNLFQTEQLQPKPKGHKRKKPNLDGDSTLLRFILYYLPSFMDTLASQPNPYVEKCHGLRAERGGVSDRCCYAVFERRNAEPIIPLYTPSSETANEDQNQACGPRIDDLEAMLLKQLGVVESTSTVSAREKSDSNQRQHADIIAKLYTEWEDDRL